ncbi:HD domain-containing protein [Enterococcus sp. DIV0660C]|uniref:HD domain-containing protein n=1 Tax=Enterococcus sp. DIV0660C TaxID=2230880 RepID=UPI001A8E97D1|nr:HD domain-containing protein [Enterococcus sp. DIV0660C]MBO0431441.1 HD domain-containing protein [Enterococcus sp. DIV0660C]
MDEKLKKIAAYSFKQLKNDQTGHGEDHTKRVVQLATDILATEPTANRGITLAAAYLHDTIDDKVVSNEEQAKKELVAFLKKIDLTKHQITSIFAIIENMSFSKSLGENAEELTIEGKIVQDADRLDALGAIGILRTAYFGGGHGHPIHDPEILPQMYANKADYRKGSTVINHFYEKLFLLPAQMNTVYGKTEAQRREQFMRDFLKEFYQEWENTSDSLDQ